MDPTEEIRREEVIRINSEVEDNDEESERKRLEEIHGQVWNTDELTRDFSVLSFAAPWVIVTRKSDGKRGCLEFQHMPRFYFNFREN